MKTFRSFAEAMREVAVQSAEAALPKVRSTPDSERGRVAGALERRMPVNKQAAMVTARAAWINRPPAENRGPAPPDPSMANELRLARLANAELGAKICNLRQMVRGLRREMFKTHAALVAVAMLHRGAAGRRGTMVWEMADLRAGEARSKGGAGY